MSPVKSKIKSKLRKGVKRIKTVLHGSCAVLLYHRVTTLESDPQLLSVSPANFNAQLKWLKEEYNVLTVEQFSHCLLNKKRFPKNSVLITFDDGYADNLLEALPVLEKHKIQALFYIATATLNTSNEYWWDAVERILLLTKKDEKKYRELLPTLRSMNAKDRDKLILQWAQELGSTGGRETHRALTFYELKKLSKSPSAVVGAHTHGHPSLAALSYSEQMDEINTSVSTLEGLLAKQITHFSFPFGTANDFNSNTIKVCKELGLKLVAANIADLANKKSNPLCFPRFIVRDWKVDEFEKNLQGFFK